MILTYFSQTFRIESDKICKIHGDIIYRTKDYISLYILHNINKFLPRVYPQFEMVSVHEEEG